MTTEQRALFEKLRTLAAAALVDSNAREAFIEAAGPMTVLVLLGDIDAKQRGYDDLHQMVPGHGDIWTKIDVLLKRLDAITAARDEACDIAAKFALLPSWPEAERISTRIAELRKVGA